MVFHKSFCDSKSPQVSWTLLSILTDLNNTVVLNGFRVFWFVCCGNFSSIWGPFRVNQLQVVSPSPSWYTVLLVLWKVLCNIQVFVSLFAFFYFHSVVHLNDKIHLTASSLLFNKRSGLLIGIKCISKSQGILYFTFSGIDSDLCMYRFSGWPKLNLLCNSLWIPFPTQSCLLFISVAT